VIVIFWEGSLSRKDAKIIKTLRKLFATLLLSIFALNKKSVVDAKNYGTDTITKLPGSVLFIHLCCTGFW